jgi:hypothetical protein
MTNWGFEENDDNGLGNDTELNGPKALRDAYAAMKKQNDELNAKLTSFLEREEKQRLASVFENLGIPGAASVYQGPADPKAAEEWANSMKQVFGGNQGGTPPVADTASEPQNVPQTGAIPPSMQAQFERVAQAGLDGTPQGNFEAAQSELGNASSVNDLIAAMQRAQRM